MTRSEQPGNHGENEPDTESLPARESGLPDVTQAGDPASVVAVSETWSGPLPHPSDLVAYNDIVQDGAERILAMAESRAAHDRKMERLEQASEAKLAMWGQWLGLAVVLGVLILAAYMAYLGATTAAAIVTGVDLVGLAAVFVLGSSRRRH